MYMRGMLNTPTATYTDYTGDDGVFESGFRTGFRRRAVIEDEIKKLENESINVNDKVLRDKIRRKLLALEVELATTQSVSERDARSRRRDERGKRHERNRLRVVSGAGRVVEAQPQEQSGEEDEGIDMEILSDERDDDSVIDLVESDDKEDTEEESKYPIPLSDDDMDVQSSPPPARLGLDSEQESLMNQLSDANRKKIEDMLFGKPSVTRNNRIKDIISALDLQKQGASNDLHVQTLMSDLRGDQEQQRNSAQAAFDMQARQELKQRSETLQSENPDRSIPINHTPFIDPPPGERINNKRGPMTQRLSEQLERRLARRKASNIVDSGVEKDRLDRQEIAMHREVEAHEKKQKAEAEEVLERERIEKRKKQDALDRESLEQELRDVDREHVVQSQANRSKRNQRGDDNRIMAIKGFLAKLKTTEPEAPRLGPVLQFARARDHMLKNLQATDRQTIPKGGVFWLSPGQSEDLRSLYFKIIKHNDLNQFSHLEGEEAKRTKKLERDNAFYTVKGLLAHINLHKAMSPAVLDTIDGYTAPPILREEEYTKKYRAVIVRVHKKIEKNLAKLFTDPVSGNTLTLAQILRRVNEADGDLSEVEIKERQNEKDSRCELSIVSADGQIISIACADKARIPGNKMYAIWKKAGGHTLTKDMWQKAFGSRTRYLCDKLNNRTQNKTNERFCKLVQQHLSKELNMSVGERIKSFEVPDVRLPHKQFLEELTKTVNATVGDDGKSVTWERPSANRSECGLVTQLSQPCDEKSVSSIFKLTKSQEFIRRYMTPNDNVKGKLLWHSQGSGKTCGVIATATSSWELEGYLIMWVTRSKLRSDMFKNVFDQVCHHTFMELIKEGLKIPKDHTERMQLLRSTSPNFLPPISYKQLGKIINREFRASSKFQTKTHPFNMLYDHWKRNGGGNDRWKKVLIVIDEIHKLFDGSLPLNEQFTNEDYDLFLKQLWLSYRISGMNSARVIMMSATPVQKGAHDLNKIMNIIADPSKNETLLPSTQKKMIHEKFLRENAIGVYELTDLYKDVFTKVALGKISYLDVGSTLASKFAIIRKRETIDVTMSTVQVNAMKKCSKIDKEKGDNRAACIMQRANFGVVGYTGKNRWRSEWNMWTRAFIDGGKDDLVRNIPVISPKFLAMLNRIRQLDLDDYAKHGKLFKHVIYSEAENGFGARNIASCMAAVGFVWVQSTAGSNAVTKDHIDVGTHNFCLLTKSGMAKPDGTVVRLDTAVVQKSLIGKSLSRCDLTNEEAKQMQAGELQPKQGVFNDELLNSHGDLIRFMVYDSAFTEGVDFKGAIKYIHRFEQSLRPGLDPQVEGRSGRFCGHRSMDYVSLNKDTYRTGMYGWPLHVITYNGIYDVDDYEDDLPALGPFESAQQYTNNMRDFGQIETILNLAASVSIDSKFNEQVNPREVGLVDDQTFVYQIAEDSDPVHNIAMDDTPVVNIVQAHADNIMGRPAKQVEWNDIAVAPDKEVDDLAGQLGDMLLPDYVRPQSDDDGPQRANYSEYDDLISAIS